MTLKDCTMYLVDDVKIKDMQTNLVVALNEYEKSFKKADQMEPSRLSTNQLIVILDEITNKISSSTLETVLFKQFIGNSPLNKILIELFTRPLRY